MPTFPHGQWSVWGTGYDAALWRAANPPVDPYKTVRKGFAGAYDAIPGDTVAANAVAGQLNTGEPSYTAGLIMNRLPLNQRATYRWVAVPGKELIYPATQNNGFGWATPTATAVAVSVTISHTE